MGGCASKPKESDTRAAESVPAEAPASPKQPEAQDPVESENEAPLVDVSEPKEEGEKPAEPKAADAEAVPEEVAENVTAKVEDGEAKVVEEPPKEESKVEESKTEGSEVATPATEVKTKEPLVTA